MVSESYESVTDKISEKQQNNQKLFIKYIILHRHENKPQRSKFPKCHTHPKKIKIAI